EDPVRAVEGDAGVDRVPEVEATGVDPHFHGVPRKGEDVGIGGARDVTHDRSGGGREAAVGPEPGGKGAVATTGEDVGVTGGTNADEEVGTPVVREVAAAGDHVVPAEAAGDARRGADVTRTGAGEQPEVPRGVPGDEVGVAVPVEVAGRGDEVVAAERRR